MLSSMVWRASRKRLPNQPPFMLFDLTSSFGTVCAPCRVLCAYDIHNDINSQLARVFFTKGTWCVRIAFPEPLEFPAGTFGKGARGSSRAS